MKKVLIIEDDPIVGHIYKTRLEKEGFEIEVCTDGQAGFYRTHEFHPEVVLLDLMLPKMNGIEILKKLRAQPQFGRLPIIVFTNAYVPNMIQEAFSAGASQVFNKATLTPRQILDALFTLVVPGYADGPDGGEGAPEPDNRSHDSRSDSGNAATEAPFHQRSSYTSHSSRQPQPPSQRPSGGGFAGAGGNPAASSAASDDAGFQLELTEAFLESKHETLTAVRKALQDFSKAQDDATRLPHLLELYRKVHSLTGSAGIAGFTSIAQMAAALEVLLKELHEKPKNINASTTRTVAHSVDFISELFATNEPDPGEPPPSNILVVDDEILSRRAITYALEKAALKSVSVEDPSVALNLATEHRYDLFFLDVQMPGMDGFELCTRVRATALNRTTPVIFVTSLTDFKSRAKSSLSGGTDLIAKPFMFIELSVKALTHVLRGRLAQKKQAA
jgi:DNA-binding response OmpR family regulator/HPt (histidine-containing phosphotransfer) domain-containing protein